MIENIIFLYNFIVHLLFSLNIILNTHLRLKNINMIFLSFGHLFVSLVMLFQVFEKVKYIYIVGIIAHSILLISQLLYIFINKKLNIFIIFFLLGQIGMIYYYYLEYHILHTKNKGIGNKEHYIIISSFIFLFLYYYYNFHIKKFINHIHHFNVSIVYILMMFLFINNYIIQLYKV